MLKRVIKFRSFNGEVMRPNVGFHPHLSEDLSAEDDHYKTNEEGRYIISPGLCEFPIEQFTGLVDIKGVEIYEGDILKEGDNGLYEVVWDSVWCKFKLDHTRTNSSYQYPEWNRGVKMEVIGNIHQNPNLLKQPLV